VRVVKWSKWTGRERPVRAIGSGKRRGCGPLAALVLPLGRLVLPLVLPMLNTTDMPNTMHHHDMLHNMHHNAPTPTQPIDAAGPPLQPSPLVLLR
jgi:hypothetical protein